MGVRAAAAPPLRLRALQRVVARAWQCGVMGACAIARAARCRGAPHMAARTLLPSGVRQDMHGVGCKQELACLILARPRSPLRFFYVDDSM